MIKLFLAFDEDDPGLGSFFGHCKDDISSSLNGVVDNIHFIPSIRCKPEYIDIVLEDHREGSFVFIGLSHGNDNGLVLGGLNYVCATRDISVFKNSFFYTNSCSSGRSLGPSLMTNNCRVFIGHDADNNLLISEMKISVNIATVGMISFFLDQITAYEAYQRTRLAYDGYSRKLLVHGDVLGSAILLQSGESLIFLGDKDTRASDLES